MFNMFVYAPIVALAIVFMAWAIVHGFEEDAYRKAHPTRRARR